MNPRRDLVAFLLILSLYSGMLSATPSVYPKNDRRSLPGNTQDDSASEEKSGLSFRLSSGGNQPESKSSTTIAATTNLSQSETDGILGRLPPIKSEANDAQSFSLREGSPPPPRTGETTAVSFPQPATSTAPENSPSGPLEVVRYAPEGDVPMAPHLSVTFSQPMVALSSQEETAASVPVRLTPQPPGKWRWVGTKTLLFEPEVRFPMSTTYSVSIPAGTRSINGGTLSNQKAWRFSTPPLSVKKSYPNVASIQPRDALIVIEFDQRIDPEKVLGLVRISDGQRALQIRLATLKEVKDAASSDSQLESLLKDTVIDRLLAFRAIDPKTGLTDLALPSGSNIKVTFAPGTPSAEGPNLTTKSHEFSFHTNDLLRVTKVECDDPCSPSDTFTIEFNNPLPDDLDSSKVKVEPALEGIEVDSYSNYLSINGLKRGNTTYRVTIDGSIQDRFHQTLDKKSTFTFKVGPSPRRFFSSGDDFIVMDPAAPTRYSVYTINYTGLNVRIYSVTPEDWPKWTAYQRQSRFSDSQKFTPPQSQLVYSKQIPIRKKSDEMVETTIDLRPGLKNNFGQIVLTVEPLGGTQTEDDDSEISESWIQVTNIGLDAFVDRTDLVGWVTSLKDGTPLNDVEVSLMPSGVPVRSDRDGLARIALTQSFSPSTAVLVARRDGDVAILPDFADRGEEWFRVGNKDLLRWFVFDDRKIYQPGEEVHVKGWLRQVFNSKGGDIGALPNDLSHVAYVLTDSRGNKLKVGSLQVNRLGGFDLAFTLPAKSNLGRTSLELQALSALEGNTYTHNLQVLEFRRPEFEVSAKTESEGPYFVGSSAEVSLNANYYAGGGLPNAPVSWSVSAVATQFTPPNRSDYTFGEWQSWWGYTSYAGSTYKTMTGVTDTVGKHRLHIDFDKVSPARASMVTAAASVVDVNRQKWSSETRFLVHPADLYVGLKSDKTFVEKGEPLVVDSIVTDLDGRLVEGRPIRMIATRLAWQKKDGEWTQVDSESQECSIQSSTSAVNCTFPTKEGGEYRIRATIRDDRQRRNESELKLWVSGLKAPSAEEVEDEDVELIPDRKEYKAGEVANIMVQAPFYPAEGVLTIQRSGIVKLERFRMEGPTTTLNISIEQGWTPNVYVQANLVGVAQRELAQGSSEAVKRPAFASGYLILSIPPFDRRLSVTASPRDKALEPGGETSISVEVKDGVGGPVEKAEVAVVVVDEAVLALSSYKLDDPLSVFYPARSADVEEAHLRQEVVLSTRRAMIEAAGRGGGGGGQDMFSMTKAEQISVMRSSAVYPGPPNQPASVSLSSGSDAPPIRARQNFNALAVFAPSVSTGNNGRAEVKVKLPDNLTRYRVMAVAVAGDKQFGSGESSITARMPLMVRASAPRFLNFGDSFEFPIVVQNQTDSAMSVDLAIRAGNARLSSPSGRRVNVPANDRVEVRIPVSTASAGTARFQVAAVSGRWSDATEVSLPVWTPATTEAFATYGEVDQGMFRQPVKTPENVFREFGGLEIETSSTQLQQLTDAFLYLQDYPYECSEQLASRILSIAALRYVLTSFKVKDLPSQTEIEASVSRDINRLVTLQNDDGGFGFWKRGDESWPFLSIHVAHSLARARQQRLLVPVSTYDQALKYLRQVESHIPVRYGLDAKRALIAYALYVRTQMGDRDTERARKLLQESGVESLSLEAIGWLLSVLSNDEASRTEVEALRNNLKNRVTESASTAHFVVSYKDDDNLVLNSDRRADAVVLEALIADQPQNDLIPKIVRGLLGDRKQGRWGNTQENVFIILALDRYFKTYENVTPSFVARVWLGNGFAGEQQFRGRSTDRKQVNVPMNYLTGTKDLTVTKEGPGRLYYRLAMNYAPNNLNLKSADSGFAVERSYEAIDDPADVRRDSEGTWIIKAGARVRVRVTMATPARRYHVALVDPIPAGFETLNPDLAVTEKIPEDKKQEAMLSYGSRSFGFGWWYWRSVWFDHQNLRNERSEAFTSLLWEGTYNYSYVARATTPGVFVVPPSKAEEMYHPETFGRSRSDRVRVE